MFGRFLDFLFAYGDSCGLGGVRGRVCKAVRMCYYHPCNSEPPAAFRCDMNLLSHNEEENLHTSQWNLLPSNLEPCAVGYVGHTGRWLETLCRVRRIATQDHKSVVKVTNSVQLGTSCTNKDQRPERVAANNKVRHALAAFNDGVERVEART